NGLEPGLRACRTSAATGLAQAGRARAAASDNPAAAPVRNTVRRVMPESRVTQRILSARAGEGIGLAQGLERRRIHAWPAVLLGRTRPVQARRSLHRALPAQPEVVLLAGRQRPRTAAVEIGRAH